MRGFPWPTPPPLYHDLGSASRVSVTSHTGRKVCGGISLWRLRPLWMQSRAWCLCWKLWITLLTIHANAVVCVCTPSWSADHLPPPRLGQWKRVELPVPAISILNEASTPFTLRNLQSPKQAFGFAGTTFQKEHWALFFVDLHLVERLKFLEC